MIFDWALYNRTLTHKYSAYTHSGLPDASMSARHPVCTIFALHVRCAGAMRCGSAAAVCISQSHTLTLAYGTRNCFGVIVHALTNNLPRRVLQTHLHAPRAADASHMNIEIYYVQ